MTYKQPIYYYCIDCGKKFDIPSQYASCKSCFANYQSERIPRYCQKCLKPKDSNEHGLCLKCYNEVMSLNVKALKKY